MLRKISSARLLTVLLLLIICSPSFSQDKPQKLLRDSVDNAFDISYYLFNLHGLLPIAMPITEPAVGYGAIGVLAYFIPKEADPDLPFQMPDVAIVAGGGTENQTWLAGGGYLGFWKKDRIRYRGFLGYADAKLKFYGAGDGILNEFPIDFNLKSFFLLQQLTFRIPNSNFFLGGQYRLIKTDVNAFENISPPINPLDFDLLSSGVSFVSEYETHTNTLSPVDGIRIHLSYMQNLEIIGSDRDFGELKFFTHYYLPVTKWWVPAFRVESMLATGEPPFYAKPYVRLRGVPVLRYQGEFVATVETEQLFNVTHRWGLVAFAGAGAGFNNLEQFEKGPTAWSAGGGFRYLLARAFGLRMGIDVAKGPEDLALYIVFGTAWNR